MSEPSDKHVHVALLVEIPVIYTADLDELREYRDEFQTDSDWLRNCLQIETDVVRVRLEISGEKDSVVAEVWGSIREAMLVEPSRGYGAEPRHLTDEQLQAHGENRLLRDERACEWCMTNSEALER